MLNSKEGLYSPSRRPGPAEEPHLLGGDVRGRPVLLPAPDHPPGPGPDPATRAPHLPHEVQVSSEVTEVTRGHMMGAVTMRGPVYRGDGQTGPGHGPH